MARARGTILIKDQNNGVGTRKPDLSDLMVACGLRRRLGRVDTDWVRVYVF